MIRCLIYYTSWRGKKVYNIQNSRYLFLAQEQVYWQVNIGVFTKKPLFALLLFFLRVLTCRSKKNIPGMFFFLFFVYGLKNILPFRTKLCLYNSFIMSHFHYFSSIWHHCLKSDSKKLDRLHERARYLYSDESSQTSTLCDRIGYSLVDRRIQNLLIPSVMTLQSCCARSARAVC